MSQVPTWLFGVPLAGAIAAVAYRLRALSPSGAVAAVAAGALAVAAGWSWGVVLIAYFVSSSLLSRFRASRKERLTGGRLEKTGPRDVTQVLANGGVFTLAAIGYRLNPDPLWQALGAGALGASAADTWATEIGTLARAMPRSILDWRPVETGTSGGITPQGLGAGMAGAGFVALAAWLARWPGAAAVAALVGGTLGCLLDSVIGASLVRNVRGQHRATDSSLRRGHDGDRRHALAGQRRRERDRHDRRRTVRRGSGQLLLRVCTRRGRTS